MISWPLNSTGLPALRSEARGTSSTTGKSRSSSTFNISRPTAPVAPATATFTFRISFHLDWSKGPSHRSDAPVKASPLARQTAHAPLGQGDFRGQRGKIFRGEREDRVAIMAGASQPGSAELRDTASKRRDRLVHDWQAA